MQISFIELKSIESAFCFVVDDEKTFERKEKYRHVYDLFMNIYTMYFKLIEQK